MGHNRHSDNTSYDNNNSPSVQCAAENTYHDLKLLSLNVCGLKSKLKIPEFIEMVNSYDIVALQETKLDDVDYIEVPGYTIFCQNRKKISRYRSGGTAYLIRNSFNEYIIMHESESKLIQWIRISKHITKTDNDVYCGNVYIPPQGTKFASQDPYLEIQSELVKYYNNMNYIMLVGDFNSRSGALPDYTIADEFLSRIHDDNFLQTENAQIISTFEQCNIPLERRSADSTTNTYGLQLLEFCKSNDLFILNGRLGSDFDRPKPTCKDRSTIDYCISDINLLKHISSFDINEFSSLYSDAHCGITMIIKAEYQSSSRLEGYESQPKMKLWKQENAESFLQNFDSSKLPQINQMLDGLNLQLHVSKSDIDDVNSQIENLFHSACINTFGMTTPKKTIVKKSNKPF